MNLSSINYQVKCKLSEIYLQLEDINTTENNIDVSETVGIVGYLITSSSKNRTIRTVGVLASIAALLYGSSERIKSKRIRRIYKNDILDLVDLIINIDYRLVRHESDPRIIKDFLKGVLKITEHLDDLVAQDISTIRSRGILGKRNIEVLMNLTRVNVFHCRIELELFLNKLDNSMIPYSGNLIYENLVSKLELTKILKEGLIIRFICIVIVILGVLPLAKTIGVSCIVIPFSTLIWALNHFFPFFTNTRKLKKAVNEFLISMKSTSGRNSIKYIVS